MYLRRGRKRPSKMGARNEMGSPHRKGHRKGTHRKGTGWIFPRRKGSRKGTEAERDRRKGTGWYFLPPNTAFGLQNDRESHLDLGTRSPCVWNCGSPTTSSLQTKRIVTTTSGDCVVLPFLSVAVVQLNRDPPKSRPISGRRCKAQTVSPFERMDYGMECLGQVS